MWWFTRVVVCVLCVSVFASRVSGQTPADDHGNQEWISLVADAIAQGEMPSETRASLIKRAMTLSRNLPRMELPVAPHYPPNRELNAPEIPPALSFHLSDTPEAVRSPNEWYPVTPNPFHLPAYRYELVEAPRYWIGDNGQRSLGSPQSVGQLPVAQQPFQLLVNPSAPPTLPSRIEAQVDELVGVIEQLQLQWQQKKSQGRLNLAEVPDAFAKPAGPLLPPEKR